MTSNPLPPIWGAYQTISNCLKMINKSVKVAPLTTLNTMNRTIQYFNPKQLACRKKQQRQQDSLALLDNQISAIEIQKNILFSQILTGLR